MPWRVIITCRRCHRRQVATGGLECLPCAKTNQQKGSWWALNQWSQFQWIAAQWNWNPVPPARMATKGEPTVDDVDDDEWEVFFRCVELIVNGHGSPTWQERRAALLQMADKFDCRTELEEVLAWGSD